MRELHQLYIDGEWVTPHGTNTFDVINPATEEIAGRLTLGDETDVDRAVQAAKRAFASYSQWSREDRIGLLTEFIAQYDKRADDLAAAVTEEMGAPSGVATGAQVPLPRRHLELAIKTLRDFEFDRDRGMTVVHMQPIGVCGLITPWNWPISVIMTKLAPVLATGCTAVLKPSEYSPFSTNIVAEIADAAGIPAGVFNVVYGDGPTVGTALSSHPDVAMVSITGSTRAGIAVAQAAAPTVKRVHQELGGKSPNVILESADVPAAVQRGIQGLMYNSGQACSAPSRMIVPRSRMDEALAAAKEAAEATTVGMPDDDPVIGPVVNKNQFDRIQSYIQTGIDEGAVLVAGGLGRPDGLDTGYFVRPTVFAEVTQEMTIAREEIFGPVIVIEPYDTVDEAVAMANDTEYGLAAYVQGGTIEEVRQVAARIPAGQVYLNGSGVDLLDPYAPFGGVGMSGNGREWGDFSFEMCLEPISMVGFNPEQVEAPF